MKRKEQPMSPKLIEARIKKLESEANAKRAEAWQLEKKLYRMQFKPLPLGHGYLYSPSDIRMGVAKLFGNGTCAVLVDPDTDSVVGRVYYGYASVKPGTTINYSYSIGNCRSKILPASYNRQPLIRILQLVADKLKKGGA